VARLLRLGFLAPDITAAILANRHPPQMTVDQLRGPIPLDWNEQRRLFGFDRLRRADGGAQAECIECGSIIPNAVLRAATKLSPPTLKGSTGGDSDDAG
jgi:hypothetical protein